MQFGEPIYSREYVDRSYVSFPDAAIEAVKGERKSVKYGVSEQWTTPVVIRGGRYEQLTRLGQYVYRAAGCYAGPDLEAPLLRGMFYRLHINGIVAFFRRGYPNPMSQSMTYGDALGYFGAIRGIDQQPHGINGKIILPGEPGALDGPVLTFDLVSPNQSFSVNKLSDFSSLRTGFLENTPKKRLPSRRHIILKTQ